MDDYIKDNYNKLDLSGMYKKVAGFPDQIEEAWESSGGFEVPPPVKEGSLVVCGMGGSAIGASLAWDLIKNESRIPVHVERGYSLPGFVGGDSTVVCVSYSGDTEEVLNLFDEARRRGCNLGVITSGGRLAEKAASIGRAAFLIKKGLPPRAAIGYLFTAFLRLLSYWGIYSIDNMRLGDTAEKLRRLSNNIGISSPVDKNMALKLARDIKGKIPVVYSGNGLLSSTAYRWKCQFNENAKVISYYNVFPELGHNEVMGWSPGRDEARRFFLIFLADADDHPKVRRRMDVTYSRLSDIVGGSTLIESGSVKEGLEGRLERLLSTVMLGDFVSVYLALERGIDPTPIEMIEDIKKIIRTEES